MSSESARGSDGPFSATPAGLTEPLPALLSCNHVRQVLMIAPEQLQPQLHTLTLCGSIQFTLRGFATVKRRLQILVAEDKLEISAIVIATLSPDFEVVGVVSNGRDLVQVALDLLPDVIIADTSMPYLGGLTAMNELRATGTNIPVVLISAVFRHTGISGHQGALGYVDKSDLVLDLVPAVRCAKSGQLFLSRNIPRSPLK
jgi:CheY-like chemotaxis protein